MHVSRKIVAEFQDLVRLDSAHNAPSRRVATANPGPTPEMFLGFLGNISMSDSGHETETLASLDDADCLDIVPPFTLQELGTVLEDLHYGKASDAGGTVADIFKYSNIPLQKMFFEYLQFDACKWVFRKVDIFQPNNWRPAAMLKMT